MMGEVSNIPKGWCCTSLEKIASWGSGGTPSRNVARYFQGTIPWVKTGELGTMHIREAAEYITEEALKNSSAKIFPKGSVGIAMYGATIGKLSIWGMDASTNQACAVGIPTGAINNEFLYYFLLAEKQKLIKAGKGGAQPNISQGIVKEWPINLPPLSEQHRIVAKIEELFSELDKGIENLKTARAQLKVYRQVLLKHAFEGKLTAQWRAENQDKLETADALLKRIQQERAQRYQQQLADWENKSPSIPLLQRGKTTSAVTSSTVPHFEKGGLGGICRGTSKPKAPKPLPPLTAEELAELPELPVGWGWTRLIEACEAVVDCHNKTAPYQASGIPLVRTPSIRDMKLNFDESIRYVSKETYEFWSKRCPPQPGDILFTREAPMGEAAIIPEGKTVCMGQRIMLLRPGALLSAKYLLSATQAHFFKKVAGKVAVGTGVKHLRVGDVEKLTFPICSPDEQLEIANQLDARLSEVDQLELTITTSLQQAEALRQSILKKAFSGQLVPQDPHDEPASKLLARIKAERAAVAAKPRKNSTGDKLSPVELTPLVSMNKEF